MSNKACVLSFCERHPPLAILTAAKIRSVDLEQKPDKKDVVTELLLPSGDILRGHIALKYIGSIGTAGLSLRNTDSPLNAALIDQWLEYCQYITEDYDMEDMCLRIDGYLSLRSFLVGGCLTVADLAIWEQFAKTSIKFSQYPNLNRWFAFITSHPSVEQINKDWNKRSALITNGKQPKNNRGEKDDKAAFDIDLPNAKMGAVVTRFPPEPSGYLHIGHAKAALLNYHVAKMYDGKLIVRFDDTNPTKEKDEFVDNILKDLDDLGIKAEQVTYTSDSFEQLLDMGASLIKNGVMYADNTPVDTMRQERMDGIESKCRNNSVEFSLKAWEEMKNGTEIGLTYCTRIKMDMQVKQQFIFDKKELKLTHFQEVNKALRDPVMFRCNVKSHWRTGAKYKVYPTYDFACPFVDSIEGVTHAMRTSEYKDREAQYQWILKEMQKINPSLPNVEVWEYARLNFVYTVLSKRKLQWFVDNSKVEGWNDPRFPTVQGMLRRGLTLEALTEFVLSQGASKNITFQEWDKIWTINKKIIDPIVPRHTAVDVSDKVKIKLSNVEKMENVIVPKHKKYVDAGSKLLVRKSEIFIDHADAEVISNGEEVTLMDWGNCIIKQKRLDCHEIDGDLHLEGDFKKTKWKLTWLADMMEVIPLELVYFDYLITKKKLDEEDDFHEFVNPNTKQVVHAIGDCNMRTLSKGDIIQLERKGYFIVDKPFWKESVSMVLFNIPDGRQKK